MIFNNQQQNQAGNVFLNQKPNIFGANQPTTSMFGNTQTQPQNNLFSGGNNQPQPQNNLFGNQTQPQNNLFSGNQTQQQPNSLFGNNQGQQQGQQQQNSLFGNNQGQPTNNLFGVNNQGNNLWSQQNNMFGNQQNIGNNNQGNIIPNNQGYNMNQINLMNPNQLNQIYVSLLNGTLPNSLNDERQMQNNLKSLESIFRYIQSLRISDSNSLKKKRVNQIEQIKEIVIRLMGYFQQLKSKIHEIKKSGETLYEKSSNYTKKIRQKLQKYKECFAQNFQQNAMIEELDKQVKETQDQMSQFISPAFQAYKRKTVFSFGEPDKFCLSISKQILNKMRNLSQRVDDILASNNSQDQFNTLTVIEQLIEYYNNVATAFREYKEKYNEYERQMIEKRKRGSYEEVKEKIKQRKYDGVSRNFYYYDKLKAIEEILQQKEKNIYETRDRRL